VETLIGIVLSCVVVGLIFVVRTRMAARRQTERPLGEKDDIPAKLLGLSLDYPGFWRSGTVDRATVEWWPRSRWGLPARLAGSRVVTITPVNQAGLGQMQIENVMLTCVDRSGARFQLAVFDASALRRSATQDMPREGWLTPGGVAWHLYQALSGPATGSSEATAGTMPRWRWLRQRLPIPPLVILIVCLLGAGFAAVPWIGAHRVDATVTIYRGEPRHCEVAGTDPVTGGRVAGLVPVRGPPPRGSDHGVRVRLAAHRHDRGSHGQHRDGLDQRRCGGVHLQCGAGGAARDPTSPPATAPGGVTDRSWVDVAAHTVRFAPSSTLHTWAGCVSGSVNVSMPAALRSRGGVMPPIIGWRPPDS